MSRRLEYIPNAPYLLRDTEGSVFALCRADYERVERDSAKGPVACDITQLPFGFAVRDRRGKEHGESATLIDAYNFEVTTEAMFETLREFGIPVAVHRSWHEDEFWVLYDDDVHRASQRAEG